MPARTGRAFPSRPTGTFHQARAGGGASYVFAEMGNEEPINPAWWNGTISGLLALHGKSSDATKPYMARLYNVTAGAVVPGSEVSIASATNTRGESAAFSFAAGTNLYRVQYGGLGGYTYTPDPYSHARVIVVVS